MSRLICLTQGKVVLVDNEDFDWLSQHKWYAKKDKSTFYAARKVRKDGKCVTILMHREILQTPVGMETDHRDHNGLNNRRHNLRAATTAQNQCNQRKRKGTTSQYKCVYWHREHAKWMAQIQVDGKLLYLGYFFSEVEAAQAYDAAAIKYFGEFACLNFKIAS